MEFEPATPSQAPGKIFAALSQVKRYAAREGISKARDGQGYKFRGIDDVQNFFATPLADNEILVTTSTTAISREILKTKNSQVVSVTVTCHYNFVSMIDGSHVTVGPYCGEATDSLDKATSKATSVAYRNMMLLTFSVPLGPGMDPEGYGDENQDGDEGDGQGDGDGRQEPATPRRRDEQQAQRQEAPRQARNGAREGALADPLPAGKQRLIDSLCARHNVTDVQMNARFRGGINTANFNDAMDWLKRGARD